MRADARQNRERLLAAAVEEFTGSADVALDAVARRAGVGIGTLYRHFPTREALVAAAYRHEVEQVCAAADELATTRPADAALREWMGRFVGYVATKRGMAAALQRVVTADPGTGLFAETYEEIVAVLRRLLAAAAEQGSIRADVDPDDVLRALRGAWLVAGEDGHGGADRLLDLLMDGLRYRAPGG